MATKQAQYRFRNGVTRLDERELNSRFFDVDGRLDALEQTRIDWQEALAQIDSQGLARLAALLARISADAAEALTDQAAAFGTAEASRDATLAAALAQALAALAADQAAYESLAAALNNIIANSEGLGAETIALALWRDTLDPNQDGVLYPDRFRDGPAAITYDGSGNVTRIDVTLPGGSIFRRDYTYAGDGAVSQIVGKLDANTLWTRTYSYDGSGALTGWTET